MGETMTGPRPADVQSIDAIVTAMYEVLSGPAGPRDWERQRFMLAPWAHLMPTRPKPDGGHGVEVFDPDGYAASRGMIFAGMSFYETEIARRVDRFGNIAHVWSTYESRRTPAEEPFMRGINSIQLYHDGSRWWIVAVLWDYEREGNPLPAA
jgi:hypothetical protein